MLSTLALVFVLAFLIGDGTTGCRASGNQATSPAVLTVQDLTKEADQLVDQEVVVRGLLENKSKNYFLRPRLVLSDASGAEIGVRAWLPTSVPPPGPNADSTPPTLATFVGKDVVLKAVVRRPNPAQPAVLEVQHAEVFRKP